MAIKALFLSGRNYATTESLYQWDYGQQLEIESPDLGSMLCEVHFACHGMSEAIVRPCNLSAGIGNVTIPDDCLEQSSAITAWIYEKGANEAHGRTRGVITIPVVARTRPGVVRDIPPETNDQYTLLIAEVNDAINDIENGIVKAKYAGEADSAKTANRATTADNATTAENANYATTAGTASSAANATSASFATNAGTANSAKKATTDINGKPLEDCLHSNHLVEHSPIWSDGKSVEIEGGIISFLIPHAEGNVKYETNIIFDVHKNSDAFACYSPLFGYHYQNNFALARLVASNGSVSGAYIVKLEVQTGEYWGILDSDKGIKYKRLSPKYPVG